MYEGGYPVLSSNLAMMIFTKWPSQKHAGSKCTCTVAFFLQTADIRFNSCVNNMLSSYLKKPCIAHLSSS